MAQYFIILDTLDRVVEKGNGTVEGSMLKFKRNKIFGFLFGDPQELEFDRDKLVPSKKSLIAYYQLDGNDITQLSFKDIGERSVSSEFIELLEKGKAIEESGLKKPPDPNKTLTWLTIAILFILSIVGILEVNQLKTVSTNLVKPLNASIQQGVRASFLAANVCTTAIQLASATLTYVNATNRILLPKQTP